MKRTRFSEYYNLGKTQAELDYVDVFIDDDIPLFIDPFVFKLLNIPAFESTQSGR